MKPIQLLISGLFSLSTLASCGTGGMAMIDSATVATVANVNSSKDEEPLTEAEVNSLTCRTYTGTYDEIFHRVLYRLQEKGCYISGSDKSAGIITAKVINEEKKKGKFCQYFSFLLTPFSDNKTEVRMTLYIDRLFVDSGYEKSTIYNADQRGIVRDKTIYDTWFETLLKP